MVSSALCVLLLLLLLPLLLPQVHDLVEVAWALAQWETPMPPNWAKVRRRCNEQCHLHSI
jgi:hypothetical protein